MSKQKLIKFYIESVKKKSDLQLEITSRRNDLFDKESQLKHVVKDIEASHVLLQSQYGMTDDDVRGIY